jgi:hypothetical protein
VFAAIADLATLEEGLTAGTAHQQAMKSAYWEDKDLPTVVAIACAGVARVLAAAAEAEDSDDTYELKSLAKAILYDLASFSWPGWDEQDVDISPTDASSGLGAARFNLSLALELDKGDLPVSRAHWMLGAHLLTGGHEREAKGSFERAARFAEKAGAAAEMELSVAFSHLCDLTVGDEAASAPLNASLSRLESLEDGHGFIAQVTTTMRVLGVEA